MTLETLSDMLKACPSKSVNIQFDDASKRFVIGIESDDSEEPEFTRSANLVQGLQVASEALVSEGQ